MKTKDMSKQKLFLSRLKNLQVGGTSLCLSPSLVSPSIASCEFAPLKRRKITIGQSEDLNPERCDLAAKANRLR